MVASLLKSMEAAITVRAQGSTIVKELNLVRDEEGLGHAKRVRRYSEDGDKLTVLLGKGAWAEELPGKARLLPFPRPLLPPSFPLTRAMMECQVREVVERRGLEVFKVAVPKQPAPDRQTAELWSRHWPLRITVKRGPSQADEGSELTAEEAETLNRLAARSVRLARREGAGNAAVVWDPRRGQVVREAADRSTGHKLSHAAMRVVEGMAERDLSMWPPKAGVTVGEKRGRDGKKKPCDSVDAGGYSLVRFAWRCTTGE